MHEPSVADSAKYVAEMQNLFLLPNGRVENELYSILS